MNNTNYTDSYLQTYRDSLKNQYDTTVANLNQQRTNDMASIMSQANNAGIMYSNFPERTKIQYDTNKYNPAIVSARNTYQTGIDTIRSSGADIANQVKTVEEKIADLNKLYAEYA